MLDWSDIDQESLTQILPHSLVELDYEEQFNGIMHSVATFRLAPTTLVLASSWDQLDYVLVAVQQRGHDGDRQLWLQPFGWRSRQDCERRTGVHHPTPQRPAEEVVLRNNRFIDRDEVLPYLTYEADTDRGSSGEPVFNRQWEVVALHHSMEIARDGNGRILTRDGRMWQPEMGSAQVKYLSLNEGVRVSRILADLAAKHDKLRENGVTAIGQPECCSLEGIGLLDGMLETHIGIARTDLIAPIPVERQPPFPRVSGSPIPGGFSRPK